MQLSLCMGGGLISLAAATTANEALASVYFLVLAMILLVVLIFLYKLTMAVGRLDRRLEKLTAHLRDLNLYDLHDPDVQGVFGEATELEREGEGTESIAGPEARDAADSTDSSVAMALETPAPDEGSLKEARPQG